MVQPNALCILLLLLSCLVNSGSVHAKKDEVRIEFHHDENGLGSVKLTGLPALSADGRTLISRAESRWDYEQIETLQATIWGGVRVMYNFDEAFEDRETEELLVRGAQRLKRMIRNRSFRRIKIKKADRRGQVQEGGFQVEVKNGVLRFSIEGTLIYKRRVKARLSQGATLGREGYARKPTVDFVGAYVDPAHRVFVVSYGEGECVCACDVAPFYQLYRWDAPTPSEI